MRQQRKLPLLVTHVSLVALMIASSSLVAQSLGSAFTYQGQLKERGQPATGLYDLQVCLFDSPSGPIPLACAPDFDDVPVEGGLFTITLDFGGAPFVGQQRYLELRVRPGAVGTGYTILAPRQLVRPAPEALRANVAGAAPWAGLTGVPAGFADGVDNDSGGTVASIETGAGLTGGPITNTGLISVAPGGIGATEINAAQVQSRVTGSCSAGAFVRGVNQDGTVVCDPAGVGSITGVTAETGLMGGGTNGVVTIGIAPSGVGAAQVNAAQVQVRVAGICPLGEYMRGVNADGSVICQSASGPTGALNDTGINGCANVTTNNLPCPLAGFVEQDGDLGRDALARAGQLAKIGAGETGFDFTKISNSGNVLPASAALGTGANDWGCTRDNVSGLTWEVKIDNPASLRHMHHAYTWYDTNSATNGGYSGASGNTATCNSTLPQCNTSAYVAAVNAQGMCGSSNWRMPTVEDLQGIVHYGRFNPAIDPAYFPNTSSNPIYVWSGTSSAAYANGAWLVGIGGDGNLGATDKPNAFPVRLVQGVP